MAEGLYQLVYNSVATLPTTESARAEAVDNLISSARKFNKERGITGALMLQSGKFTHVLEGELTHIELAYERIAVNTIHRDIVILDVRQIPERTFPEHSLAFLQRNLEPDCEFSSDESELTEDANTVVSLLQKALVSQRPL